MAIKIAGIAATTALTLSLQGVAGSVVNPSWGTPEANSIQIVADRTTLKCAPDTVRFAVDLSNSGFDTPAPTGGQIYNQQYHDLVYLWNFDDPVAWLAPEKVLAEWRNSGVAKGPFVVHAFTQPGVYIVSVLVIEPSSSKTRYATIKIVVQARTAVISGADVICVSSSGDFADAPAGSVHLTLSQLLDADADWATTHASASVPKAWLFRAGEEFTVGVTLDARQAGGIFLGSYGAGARPVLNADVGSNSNATFVASGTYTGDLRIADLEMAGDFDPSIRGPQKTISLPYATGALIMNNNMDVLLHNCRMRNFGGSSVISEGNTTVQNAQVNIHLNDTLVTEFGGQYALFFGPKYHPLSSVAFTGICARQNPNATRDQSLGSILRIEFFPLTYMAGSDWFTTVATGQACAKFQETPWADGGLVNVHSAGFESPWVQIILCNNTAGGLGRAAVHNIILDGIVLLGGYEHAAFLNTNASGLTLRNSLGICPAVQRSGAGDLTKFIQVGSPGSFGAEVADAPIRAYSNTFRVDRVGAANPVTLNYYNADGSAFTALSETNNVRLRPEETGQGPLTDAALWTPRGIGERQFGIGPGSGTLSGDVADTGALPEIPYWEFYAGRTATEADFAGTGGNATMTIGATIYYESEGDISVVYGAAGVTVTNTSGVTWPDASAYSFIGDMGSTAPLVGAWATPSDAVKDSKPDIGSPALGAASSGDVAYDDLSAPGAIVRGDAAAADTGAWQMTA